MADRDRIDLTSVDVRPDYLKNLDRPVAEHAHKNLAQYELKRHRQFQRNAYWYDVDATRFYFTTPLDRVSRIIFIISNILLVVLLFIFLQRLTQVGALFVTNFIISHLGSLFGNLTDAAEPVIKIGMAVLGFVCVAIALTVILPPLLVKNIRSARFASILITIMGLINIIIIVGLGALNIIYEFSLIALILVSLGGLFAILSVLAMILWQVARRRYLRDVENRLSAQVHNQYD